MFARFQASGFECALYFKNMTEAMPKGFQSRREFNLFERKSVKASGEGFQAPLSLEARREDTLKKFSLSNSLDEVRRNLVPTFIEYFRSEKGIVKEDKAALLGSGVVCVLGGGIICTLAVGFPAVLLGVTSFALGALLLVTGSRRHSGF